MQDEKAVDELVEGKERLEAACLRKISSIRANDGLINHARGQVDVKRAGCIAGKSFDYFPGVHRQPPHVHFVAEFAFRITTRLL
ncbi:MAG: hypothetical protein ACI4VV_07125 [Eggerthellaceae bacterium]